MVTASKFTRSRREAAITETEARPATTLAVFFFLVNRKQFSAKYAKSQWFSGKIRACHARAPCSIHGCDIVLSIEGMLSYLLLCHHLTGVNW
jgi:hypothetical protein